MQKEQDHDVSFVILGHGGWKAYTNAYTTLHGEGTGWCDYVTEKGLVVVDLTTMPDGKLIPFIVGGPMLDTDLKKGTWRNSVSMGGEEFPHDPDAEWLGAHSLAQISLDGYLWLTGEAGADIRLYASDEFGHTWTELYDSTQVRNYVLNEWYDTNGYLVAQDGQPDLVDVIEANWDAENGCWKVLGSVESGLTQQGARG